MPLFSRILGYTKFAALFVGVTAIAQQKPIVLHIAAAADLQPVMPALAQAYEKETGVKLEVSFGSSSALAEQIVNGAPMDVFLGADFSFPEKVVAANLADGPAPTPYATGTLVVWTRKDSGIAPITIDRVTDAKVTRIAVADQFHAPYGRAAYAALTSMKVLDKVQSKLVTAENVGQAAQFAESGNAQMAFISLTLASTDHMKQAGTFDRVPKVTYPEIRQCGVVVKSSPNLIEARKFLAWLTSAKIQDTLPNSASTPAPLSQFVFVIPQGSASPFVHLGTTYVPQLRDSFIVAKVGIVCGSKRPSSLT